MKTIKVILITILTLSFFLNANAKDVDGDIFSTTNEFLKTYVSNGAVDYESIVNNKGELNDLVAQYQSINLKNYNGSGKKALLINAYNILVIKSVIDNYPTNSPMDINGFFDGKTHSIFGTNLTLNQLEKEVLFGQFKDARMHFVLVCAAKGCPTIAPYAFTSSNIESKLNQQTRNALNSSFIKVNSGENKVELSKIFEWYKADFTTNGKTVTQYINQFRNEAIPENYAVSFYEYDWTLNKKK